MMSANVLAEILGREVAVTSNYYVVILDGKIPQSLSIALCVPKEMVRMEGRKPFNFDLQPAGIQGTNTVEAEEKSPRMIERKSLQEVLPFYRFDEMADEMNLGFNSNSTWVVWGKFMTEGGPLVDMPAFIVTKKIAEAKHVMFSTCQQDLVATQNLGDGCCEKYLVDYVHMRKEAALYDNCGDGELVVAKKEAVFFVFPFGYANVLPDPGILDDISMNDEEIMAERAQNWVKCFDERQEYLEDYQASNLEGFEELVTEWLEKYYQLIAGLSQNFWERYYPGVKHHELICVEEGVANFLGENYDANLSAVALPNLMGDFYEFEKNVAEYRKHSLAFDRFRGFLCAYPVKVEDYFGQFVHKKVSISHIVRCPEVRIEFDALKLIYRGRLVGIYAGTDRDYGFFVEDIYMLMRKWQLRVLLWRYHQ